MNKDNLTRRQQQQQELFNNPDGATCILRVIDHSEANSSLSFKNVGKHDQFYWIHESVLAARSHFFKHAFSTRHFNIDHETDDTHKEDQEYPSSHYAYHPPTITNGIQLQWQGIRTGANKTIPIITPYPRHGRVPTPRKPASLPSTSSSAKASGTSTPTTTPTRKTVNTNNASTLPLLTIRMPYSGLFPEIMYWLYTGNDARMQRSLNSCTKKEEKDEAIDVMKAMGLVEKVRSGGWREAVAFPAAEPPDSALRRKWPATISRDHRQMELRA
ncbi:hypothetical protein DFJ77DRAFT_438094 [Powellomyces hirtus]|nr:hypothetical protein DFJ77DRAFT_438094 [Powellomyces hirtus]